MIRKLLGIFVLSTTMLQAELAEPYNSVKQLPFDPHGWFANSKPLQSIIEKKQPKTVIEVGSWLGKSTRFIASKIPQGGKVYAVDTWEGSPQEQVHLKDPRLPFLYQQFLSNVIHAGLTDVIIPIRMKSIEASKALNIQADLIYIDAAHDTQSVTEDILAWYPHLQKDGIMTGDDWNWTTVRTAVVNCANKLNKKVSSYDNFWWYHD